MRSRATAAKNRLPTCRWSSNLHQSRPGTQEERQPPDARDPLGHDYAWRGRRRPKKIGLLLPNQSALVRRFVYRLTTHENVPLNSSAATADRHLLRVGVHGSEIVVTASDSDYAMTYHEPANSPQLLAKSFPRKDRRVSMTLATFLTAACKLANDKARELGWIE